MNCTVYAGGHYSMDHDEHVQVRTVIQVVRSLIYIEKGNTNGTNIQILILNESFVEDAIWIRRVIIASTYNAQMEI